CGSKKHYWLASKWQFQCSSCSFRTTLKSGTVMENSNLSVRKWFLIMLFMTSTKKGMSACEIKRQMEHSRYNTVLSVMHRIRDLMGKRDNLYQLNDMIEFDEGYFETQVSEKVRSNLKRGKGSQRQLNVAVMAESVPLEDLDTGKKSKSCRFFKMTVLKGHSAEAINNVVKESINEKSIVFTDRSASYIDIEKYIEVHVMEKSTPEVTKETLKWVHIAISNAKRNFLGVYHKIKGENLQRYLNEFVYKLNRRYFDSVFERLLVASVFPYWYNSD
ncbi:MAG: IS1595 family transposase, partial [Bacteroidales bacterium]